MQSFRSVSSDLHQHADISTDEDPSLPIESSAIINVRGVSTKLNKYIVFTMQTYKKLITFLFLSRYDAILCTVSITEQTMEKWYLFAKHVKKFERVLFISLFIVFIFVVDSVFL